METMVRWCAAKRIRIEPYGLDIVPELAALARSRLPQWSERIFVGNALTWMAPIRFDFVPTNLEYVPPHRGRDLVETADAGHRCRGRAPHRRRHGNADPSGPGLDDIVRGWGFSIAGAVDRPHRIRVNEVHHVLWIDAPARTMA